MRERERERDRLFSGNFMLSYWIGHNVCHQNFRQNKIIPIPALITNDSKSAL